MSLCTAFSFLAMQAQLVVNNNGQVIVGAEEHHAAVLNGGHYPSTSELYVEQTSDNGMVLIADGGLVQSQNLSVGHQMNKMEMMRTTQKALLMNMVLRKS